jgi:hypothetical protein
MKLELFKVNRSLRKEPHYFRLSLGGSFIDESFYFSIRDQNFTVQPQEDYDLGVRLFFIEELFELLEDSLEDDF